MQWESLFNPFITSEMIIEEQRRKGIAEFQVLSIRHLRFNAFSFGQDCFVLGFLL